MHLVAPGCSSGNTHLVVVVLAVYGGNVKKNSMIH